MVVTVCEGGIEVHIFDLSAIRVSLSNGRHHAWTSTTWENKSGENPHRT